MNRLHIDGCTAADGNPVPVGTHRVNDILADASVPQEFRSLQAVLLRIQFKINVMKKSYNSPILSIISIPKLFCIPLHYSLHCQRMLDMKWILVILFQ